MVVLAPVERAPEDLLDQDSEDTVVNADNFEERVARVDARELPTVGTLTFMHFGVPSAPKLSCLGVTPRGRMRTLERCCPQERDVMLLVPRGRVDAVDCC